MRYCHYTIGSQQVHQHAQTRLQRHLRLKDHGPKCTAPVLYAILFWAASRLASLAAACASLTRAPSDQAVRNALLATLPDFARLQQRLNCALRDGLPRALRRRAQTIALDVILLPYYGTHQHDPAEIYKGQFKAGTRKFHAYATAYVIYRGCRWTLALRSVGHADPWADLVRDLLRQVRAAGVSIRHVLLDRGFYCVDVIRYLQHARYPFIMPAIRRGRSLKHPKGPSGTWVFLTWKHSGWTEYVLQDKHERQRTRVRLAVCRVRGHPDRKGRRRMRVWLYATWGLPAGTSLNWVRQTYRRRFGIESSYRQLNEARIRTSTRDPRLRLLFVGLALVLRNVYVWLHWEVLARHRRGYRQVDLQQLPLKALLRWLAVLAEDWFGLNQTLPSERPMRE